MTWELNLSDLGFGLLVIWVLFIANLLLRNLVVGFARFCGLAHPLLDARWPRLPWRPLWRTFSWSRDRYEEIFHLGKRSTARFASVWTQLSHQYRPGHLPLGRVRAWWGGGLLPVVGQKIKRHCMIIASIRSGKTNLLRSMIALMLPQQTGFFVDPKGDFAESVLRPLKRRGARVAVIDPMRITRWSSASINMFDQIDALNERTSQDLTVITILRLALADIPQDNAMNPFFPKSARALWAGINAYVYTCAPTNCRSQVYARDLLMRGFERAAHDANTGQTNQRKAMDLLFMAMAQRSELDGFIAKAGKTMLEMRENTRREVLATTRSYTQRWDIEQVRRVSLTSDDGYGNSLRLTDLKQSGGNLIVDLALPSGEIRDTFAPMVRALMMFNMQIFELIPGSLSPPCKFVLEEMKAIGNIPGLSNFVPIMAGLGAEFTGVVQDLEGLQAVSEGDAMGFLGNADLVFFMGSDESSTIDYVHEHVLGVRTLTDGTSHELMTKDQLRRFLRVKPNGGGNMIVRRANQRPMRTRQMPYFKDLPVTCYDADVQFVESLPKRLVRKLLRLSASDTPSEPQLRPTPAINHSTAEALFGLQQPYGARDVDARAELLRAGTFEESLVNSAQRLLRAGLNH